jgi:peptidyl-prolyl cis-trans isomerase SurA
VFRRKATAVLAVGLASVAVLSGCRTSPDVAAYVGDDQLTVGELQAAVDERLADPDIAAYAAGKESSYTRQVLTLQVTDAVYAAAARRYDVDVSDAEVRDRIQSLLGGAAQDEVFAQLAQQQGVNAEDVEANIRQQLVRAELAAAAGKADLSDAALQQRYEQSLGQLTQVQLGIITVPDQPTADAVLAQLLADPAGYPAVAAQHPGNNTLPEVQSFASGDLPEVLAESIGATPAGQGFTQPVAEAGGVVVGFVSAVVTPSFADVRSQLAQQAGSEADAAGAALVSEFQADVDVDVNPRYGVLQEGQVVPADGGVVKVLEQAGAGAAGAAAPEGSGD